MEHDIVYNAAGLWKIIPHSSYVGSSYFFLTSFRVNKYTIRATVTAQA